MDMSVLEIKQLENGDIVLQNVEGTEEPLVSIRFSGEAKKFITGIELEIAKAMIQAGFVVSNKLIDNKEVQLRFMDRDQAVLH